MDWVERPSLYTRFPHHSQVPQLGIAEEWLRSRRLLVASSYLTSCAKPTLEQPTTLVPVDDRTGIGPIFDSTDKAVDARDVGDLNVFVLF